MHTKRVILLPYSKKPVAAYKLDLNLRCLVIICINIPFALWSKMNVKCWDVNTVTRPKRWIHVHGTIKFHIVTWYLNFPAAKLVGTLVGLQYMQKLWAKADCQVLLWNSRCVPELWCPHRNADSTLSAATMHAYLYIVISTVDEQYYMP